MLKYRDLDPLDPIPANLIDALNEFLSTLASNFRVRIKPGVTNTLQVPAGAGNDAVAIAIEGKWRFVEANVEQAGAGAARTVDVFITTTANNFAAGSPGEIDNTNYAFALSIQTQGNVPAAVAHYRKVATAVWSGAAFTEVTNLVEVPAELSPKMPSQAQRDALAGTSGAPGDGNRFVTNADARNTNARAPTAHEASHLPGAADPLPWAGSIHGSGTLAARPAAAAGNAGFTYVATDVNGGTPYRSSGSAWVQQAAGVTQAPPDGSVTTAKLADNSVTPAKRAIVPFASVYKNSPTVVNSDVDTPLTFPGTAYDTDGLHAGPAGYLIPQTPGLYLLSAGVRWSTSSGVRDLWFRIDGAELEGMHDSRVVSVGHDAYQTLVCPWVASAGEHAEVMVWHDAPGPISVLATAFFHATYLGKVA